MPDSLLMTALASIDASSPIATTATMGRRS
jgi:hypothetical protein